MNKATNNGREGWKSNHVEGVPTTSSRPGADVKETGLRVTYLIISRWLLLEAAEAPWTITVSIALVDQGLRANVGEDHGGELEESWSGWMPKTGNLTSYVDVAPLEQCDLPVHYPDPCLSLSCLVAPTMWLSVSR